MVNAPTQAIRPPTSELRLNNAGMDKKPPAQMKRAELRAECNGLKATVHVGAHGLTDALIGALDDALRTHELVKVQLGKPVELPAREAARQLAVAVHADGFNPRRLDLTGRTLGKRTQRLRVLREDGSPLRPVDAVKRYGLIVVATYALSFVLGPLAAVIVLVGVTTWTRNPNMQALQDRIAHTIVVSEATE